MRSIPCSAMTPDRVRSRAGTVFAFSRASTTSSIAAVKRSPSGDPACWLKT